MRALRCAICKRACVGVRKTCSTSCANSLRARGCSADTRRARAKAGGVAHGKAAKAKRQQRYAASIERVGAVAACVVAYERGYRAGHRARRYVELSEKMLAIWQRKKQRTIPCR